MDAVGARESARAGCREASPGRPWRGPALDSSVRRGAPGLPQVPSSTHADGTVGQARERSGSARGPRGGLTHVIFRRLTPPDFRYRVESNEECRESGGSRAGWSHALRVPFTWSTISAALSAAASHLRSGTQRLLDGASRQTSRSSGSAREKKNPSSPNLGISHHKLKPVDLRSPVRYAAGP